MLLFINSCSGLREGIPAASHKSTGELVEALVDPSEITLPVLVPLTSLVSMADLESGLPMSEIADDTWKEIPEQGSGKAIKYRWDRNPFEVTAHDSVLVVSTEIRYQVQYAHRVKQPWPFTNYTWITLGSCGYHEPMRRVRVRLTSNLALQSDWRLHSTTTITTDFIDNCEATFFGINVTDRIKRILDDQLLNIAERIDERVPKAVDVHAKAEGLWQTMLSLSLSIPPWDSGLRFSPMAFN